MFERVYKQYFSKAIPFQGWLALSSGFGLLLLLTRIVVTGYFTYAFLAWNLLLAFIPYAITNWIEEDEEVRTTRWKLLAALGLWLLFEPNAFYILTDLFHLDHIDSAPKWFDLLLLFSFAWNGLLLGVTSLYKVERIIRQQARYDFSWLLVFMVMWLNAFGIYLGRFLRFNSWDVLTHPISLFNAMSEVLLHPLSNSMEWGMITCYAVFMTLLYFTIRKLAETFHEFKN